MHYTDGSFKVREEEESMILNYDSNHQLADQILFQAFEFLSIIEDNDEQKVDSLFGLGLPTPEHSEENGKMTMLRWMLEKQYIRERMVSLYIKNWNGADIRKTVAAQ